MDAQWWSIEVFDERTTASAWRSSYERALVESALTNGALNWEWHEFTWGVVFEVAFKDEQAWHTWRELPGTRSALDAVPDPINGLLIYRGRGGSSGSTMPRPPRPAPSAAAVELPEVVEEPYLDLLPTELTEPYPQRIESYPPHTSVA